MGCGFSLELLTGRQSRSKHKHRKHKHRSHKHKSHHGWPDGYVMERRSRRHGDHYVAKRTSSHRTPVVCRRTTRRERETIRVDGDVRHSRRTKHRHHEVLSPRDKKKSEPAAPSETVSLWLCCLSSTRAANYGEGSGAGAACRRCLVDVAYLMLWNFGDEEIYLFSCGSAVGDD